MFLQEKWMILLWEIKLRSYMDKSVIIKSNRHGLVLNLDSEMSFPELREKIRERFSEASKFFGNVKMALTIEGRTLSSGELNEVIDIISETTEVEILTVIDNSEVNDTVFRNELKRVFNELDACAAEIYPFSVEENMKLEFKRSVIILGNVSKTAEIHTDGSVFVLGNLEGSVYAGELGNTSAKVFANRMNPVVVCIADIPYKPVRREPPKARFGFIKKKQDVSDASESVLLSLSEKAVHAEQVPAPAGA